MYDVHSTYLYTCAYERDKSVFCVRVCVCACAYIYRYYVYIYYVHVRARVCVRAYIYMCARACVWLRGPTCVCACARAYTYMCAHTTRVCACVRVCVPTPRPRNESACHKKREVYIPAYTPYVANAPKRGCKSFDTTVTTTPTPIRQTKAATHTAPTSCSRTHNPCPLQSIAQTP